MTQDTWTKTDTEKARQYWEAYQQRHDLSGQQGQTAGIDPASGRIWFGPSAKAIVAQLAAKYRLPSVYNLPEYAEAGGLASYGADLKDAYGHAGAQIDRIFKGAKPGDLPIESAGPKETKH